MNAVEDIQKAVISDGQIQLGFSTNDEETDLYNYEMVSGEFFAQIKEPAFTINVNKVYVNTAAVRLLPKVDYVKFMINRDEKKLVIKPCSDMDIQGYNWAKEKEGKRYPSHRTGEPFVQSLCMLMNWNPQFRYKISGKKNRAKGDGEEILVFDLTSFKCFEKEISVLTSSTFFVISVISSFVARFFPFSASYSLARFWSISALFTPILLAIFAK